MANLRVKSGHIHKLEKHKSTLYKQHPMRKAKRLRWVWHTREPDSARLTGDLELPSLSPWTLLTCLTSTRSLSVQLSAKISSFIQHSWIESKGCDTVILPAHVKQLICMHTQQCVSLQYCLTLSTNTPFQKPLSWSDQIHGLSTGI